MNQGTLKNLSNVGFPKPIEKAPLLDNSIQFCEKVYHWGHPFYILGNGFFFQPYIPLQQLDILLSNDTRSFLVGTSNAIFTQHKSLNLDVIVHVIFF